MAITGRYDSKKDSFGVDAAYAIDDTNTIYGSYGVTDEKVTSLGLETAFAAFGRSSTVDLVYKPPADSASAKISVRNGKTKLTGFFSFANFKDDNVKNHAETYELDAKLSGVESLKMSFNAKTRASKIKVSRKLDPKNRIEGEYSYVDAASKYVSVKLKHQYNNTHTFGVTTNYGPRRYKVEWDCKTENGPWNISSTFPFNARYVYRYIHSNVFSLFSRLSLLKICAPIPFMLTVRFFDYIPFSQRSSIARLPETGSLSAASNFRQTNGLTQSSIFDGKPLPKHTIVMSARYE